MARRKKHIEEQVTGPRFIDICGFCGKNLKPRVDVAWRIMATVEGIACAANYCPQSRTDALDPNKKGRPSRCEYLGLQNPKAVAARLRKYEKAMRETSHGVLA